MASLLKLLAMLLACCLHIAYAKTVTHRFDISWISANPDGRHWRSVVAINGIFPPPTIHVTVGDELVIYTTNSLGNSSTTLHFHGLYQRGSSAQDGPAGVTQCPIPAGGSFTYKFMISQPGTYFYHSHFEGQYPDGLRAPLIVHDPNSPFTSLYPPTNEHILTLSDWYHDTMSSLASFYLNATLNPSGAEPLPPSLLINDSQNVTLPIKAGETYLLRIINFAAFSQVLLHFNDHEVEIVEVDGIYTHPRKVKTLYVAVGQRYGVLLRTKKTNKKNFAITAMADTEMFDGYPDLPSWVNPKAIGWLVYDHFKELPKGLEMSLEELREGTVDDFELVPWDNEPLLENPSQRFVLDLDFFEVEGQNRAGFNNITWLPPKIPSLFTALTTGTSALNNLTYGINAHAMVLDYNAVVEVVINNYDDGGHPIHIHGHAVQLVARSSNGPYPSSHHRNRLPLPPYNPSQAGQQYPMPPSNALGYDPLTAEPQMPKSPMKRDTWMLAANGYTVIRFRANNPGVWFLHCHMDWHNIAGLAATLIEAPLEIQKNQHIPHVSKQNCLGQGMGIEGNAAGNTVEPDDLTGLNTRPKPLGVYTGTTPVSADRVDEAEEEESGWIRWGAWWRRKWY